MNSQEELIKRLTRFYREAGAEVSARPPVWMPAKRGTARWLQPLLASVLLLALAVGLAVTIRMVREEAHRKITPFPIPSASHSPSPSASPTPLTSWVTRRVPFGTVTELSLDSSAIFALYAPAPVRGGIDRSQIGLARIDRGNGALATGGVFPYAKSIARVAAGLWVAAGPSIGEGPAGADAKWLTLVDPVSLSVKQRVRLPAQADSGGLSGPRLAGTSNLLWLAYGPSLYRLDPTTGRIVLTESLPPNTTSLSIDPAGRRLYAGAVSGEGTGALVIEWDAATGARIASAPTGGAELGGPQVTAAADGVWIAYATGMMGAVEYRRATDLSMPAGPQYGHTNGIRVFAGGNALWFVDPGAGRLACADLSTGRIAASSQETLPGVVVADGNGSYLGDSDGVGFLRPDPACPH